jgi:hypothetical protein
MIKKDMVYTVAGKISNNWPCAEAHTYNPSYLGDGDWEDYCSRPAWGKS